jgi:hypothetical protein
MLNALSMQLFDNRLLSEYRVSKYKHEKQNVLSFADWVCFICPTPVPAHTIMRSISWFLIPS